MGPAVVRQWAAPSPRFGVGSASEGRGCVTSSRGAQRRRLNLGSFTFAERCCRQESLHLHAANVDLPASRTSVRNRSVVVLGESPDDHECKRRRGRCGTPKPARSCEAHSRYRLIVEVLSTEARLGIDARSHEEFVQ
jgi:hypothetical protein